MASPVFSTGPVSSSKLSIHLLGGRYSAGARQVVANRPRLLKLFDLHYDMREALRDYKARAPGGVTVLRVWHTRKWTLADDPESAGEAYWFDLLKPQIDLLTPEERSQLDYIEGPNEGDSTPTWFSVEQAAWFGRFWVVLARRIGEAGFRPCVGSIAVGQPPGTMDEITAKFRAFLPAMVEAQRWRGSWSYHAYTVAYSTDPDDEDWYSLRYRRLHRILTGLDARLGTMPLLLTEGGVDYGGNPDRDGWRARGTSAQYQAWLKWFDGELRRDPYVVGVTLFQSGDRQGWKSFEVEPVMGWLSGYLAARPGR